jgi:hypothetical protein
MRPWQSQNSSIQTTCWISQLAYEYYWLSGEIERTEDPMAPHSETDFQLSQPAGRLVLFSEELGL